MAVFLGVISLLFLLVICIRRAQPLNMETHHVDSEVEDGEVLVKENEEDPAHPYVHVYVRPRNSLLVRFFIVLGCAFVLMLLLLAIPGLVPK